MAGGGGGGGGDVSRAQQPGRGQRRGHRQKDEAWLPLDVIAEIAARSDPATLVRCAATCRGARRRIAGNPSLLGRLRLRHTERFVLPLLRGHLAGITTYSGGEKTDVYMVEVDTTSTAADATRLVNATRLVEATFAEAGQTLRNVVSMDSRGGLVLVRASYQPHLLVCNLDTRRCLALPPEPAFPYADRSTDWTTCSVQHVLLVGGSDDKQAAGDGATAVVGRPFQVLRSKLLLSQYRSCRRLLVHTFSSEHGAWSALTEIPTPNLDGTSGYWHQRPLVVGDVVHWLCLTSGGSYVLMLHMRAARVNVTVLPASFPRDDGEKKLQYLLATATAGGNPVVLVLDDDRISAWEQSKHTKLWKARPQVVIEKETILGFKDDGLAAALLDNEIWRRGLRKHVPKLLWFGESSGAVLLEVHVHYSYSCLLWLDLQSKKIVRCFSPDRRMQQVYCPYELDLSSWVPTFSDAVTL